MKPGTAKLDHPGPHPVGRGLPAKLPIGPAVVPHRKNAAEWVMYVVLYPFAWAASRLSRKGGQR